MTIIDKWDYSSKSAMIMELCNESQLRDLLAELIESDKSGLVEEILEDLDEKLTEELL
tara:strand:+ start:61 stop:234 length:174 start_codon:yes stop_codon:yes gene_type:complete